MTCCSHCADAEDLFGGRTARRDLRRYRRRGPSRSTRLLLEALRGHGVRGRTLLDVGGGIGAIQHELFRSGLARAVQVDASSAYLEASRREAARQGHLDAVTYHHGDFVEIAPTLPPADIVTLDRVLCCYPELERLVGASLDRAERLYGLVYPRERWGTRAASAVGNLFFRLRGSAFRSYIHSSEVVDALVRGRGWRRASYARTFLWHVVTYAR